MVSVREEDDAGREDQIQRPHATESGGCAATGPIWVGRSAWSAALVCYWRLDLINADQHIENDPSLSSENSVGRPYSPERGGNINSHDSDQKNNKIDQLCKRLKKLKDKILELYYISSERA